VSNFTDTIKRIDMAHMVKLTESSYEDNEKGTHTLINADNINIIREVKCSDEVGNCEIEFGVVT
jgi:hypothetical protein